MTNFRSFISCNVPWRIFNDTEGSSFGLFWREPDLTQNGCHEYPMQRTFIVSEMLCNEHPEKLILVFLKRDRNQDSTLTIQLGKVTCLQSIRTIMFQVILVNKLYNLFFRHQIIYVTQTVEFNYSSYLKFN